MGLRRSGGRSRGDGRCLGRGLAHHHAHPGLSPEQSGGRAGQSIQHGGLIQHGAGELRIHPQGKSAVAPNSCHLVGVVQIGVDRGGDLSPHPRREGGPEGAVTGRASAGSGCFFRNSGGAGRLLGRGRGLNFCRGRGGLVKDVVRLLRRFLGKGRAFLLPRRQIIRGGSRFDRGSRFGRGRSGLGNGLSRSGGDAAGQALL